MIIFMGVLLVLNIIKASHDTHIDAVEDYNDRRAWHKKYLAHYIVMVAGFIALVNPHFVYWFPMLGYAATIRIVIFNTILNKLRKKPFFYLGGEGVDGKFKGKEAIYYVTAFIGFAASIYMLLQYG